MVISIINLTSFIYFQMAQVAGGKYDAVSVDPHPSPWVPTTYNRMVFTHVGKAGGSYLIQLMEALAKRNQFTVVKGALTVGFNPPRQKLFDDIISLKNNTVYENRACYVNGLDDRDFISIVRDPFDLMNSHFYYGVDKRSERKKQLICLRIKKRTSFVVVSTLSLINASTLSIRTIAQSIFHPKYFTSVSPGIQIVPLMLH